MAMGDGWRREEGGGLMEAEGRCEDGRADGLGE